LSLRHAKCGKQIADEAIDDLLNRTLSLASEIGDAIGARRQAAQSARRGKSPMKTAV
jgi:hypothetical protein